MKYVNDQSDTDYRKYRLTYEGGSAFVEAYLKRFTLREDLLDFKARKSVSYCPSFAKAALIDIRNSIFQRLSEVTRVGDARYVSSTKGEDGGVDGSNTSMQHFLGSVVLDELLPMGKVVIWVDSSKGFNRKPYVYIYRIEDLAGVDDIDNPRTILLRDKQAIYDDLGLLTGTKTVYRYARVTPKGVEVSTLDVNKKVVPGTTEFLKLNKLPVIVLKIGDSLLKDVADYQIALTNIVSSDVSYVLRANFPFYVEQYDVGADLIAKQMATPAVSDPSTVQKNVKDDGVNIGTTSGRRYAKGIDAPRFISPSTDPMFASMSKQKDMKHEMRSLVNLSLSNLTPTRSSSESKEHDDNGLDAGLAYIGQELERGERFIIEIWHMYLGSDADTHVSYPKNYSLKTDEQRQLEADKDLDMVGKLPTLIGQKELTKRALIKLFGNTLDAVKSLEMLAEVDSAQVLTIDPLVLHKDLEAHLVGQEYASSLRGYPKEEALKAAEDHAAKLSRIAVAQSEASILAGNNKINTPGISTGASENEKKRIDALENKNV